MTAKIVDIHRNIGITVTYRDNSVPSSNEEPKQNNISNYQAPTLALTTVRIPKIRLRTDLPALVNAGLGISGAIIEVARSAAGLLSAHLVIGTR